MEQSTISTPPAIKPLALTIGLASPLWMAYGAAASVGATWWWMARMSRFAAPHFAEAAAVAEPVETILEAPLEAIQTLAAPEPLANPAETPVAYPLEASSEKAAASEPTVEPLLERPDELTLLRGVGPRVADALVARGVTTFVQLAAWTDLDMAHFDKELKLLGRSTRYDFLGQARALAEG